MSDVQQRIDTLVKGHKVVLFMKGTAQFPQCGFSGRAIQILKACGVQDLTTVNVLEDEEIRQGIKAYANWPTIPQLYINGEFVEAASGERFDVINPATEEVLASVASAGIEDAMKALDAEELKNTNKLKIYVFDNEAKKQARLVAALDNLGKGAAGAAAGVNVATRATGLWSRPARTPSCSRAPIVTSSAQSGHSK